MRLTVLADNNTLIDNYLLGEPALSFFIETEGIKVLFDAGYSDVFIKNAEKLGIDLHSVNYVVFSHGHNDHTGGIRPLLQLFAASPPKVLPALVAHPDILLRKECEGEGSIGIDVTGEELSSVFRMYLTDSPCMLTDNLFFLGEIPRRNLLENRSSIGKIVMGKMEADDYILDDSALVFKSRNGLVIITGCSHSGICNIVEAAREVTGERKVVSIIGGFHLMKPEERLMDYTVQYLNSLELETIYPCHCTDLEAKLHLAGSLPVLEVGSGMVLEFNE